MKPLSQLCFSASFNSGSGLDVVWTVKIFLGEKYVITFCSGTCLRADDIFSCPIIMFAFNFFFFFFLALFLCKRNCFVLLAPLGKRSPSPSLAWCLSSLNLCWANHFSGSEEMKRAPSVLLSGHEPEQPRERCAYCFTGILSQILGVSSARLQGQPIKEVLLLAEQ